MSFIIIYKIINKYPVFTSKFDYYKKGKAQLTQEELLGLKLFEDPKKGIAPPATQRKKMKKPA
jgi:cytochrome c peroxidase